MDTMTIQRAALIARRWWLPILIGTILAAGVSYAVSRLLPRVYNATAILNVNPGLGTNTGGTDNQALVAAATEAGIYAQTVKTAEVAQAALAQVGRLHHPVDTGTLLRNTTTQATPPLTLITIDVHAQDPSDAAALATALGRALIANVMQHTIAPLQRQQVIYQQRIAFYSQDEAETRQLLASFQEAHPFPSPPQKQLAGTYTNRINRDVSRAGALNDIITGIEVRLAGLGDSISLQQQAVTPDAPISPRTTVNVLLAALVALLVLLGVAVLSDLLDARPRTPDDVAALLDLPLLGIVSAVPRSSSALVALTEPTTPCANEYRLLRTSSGLTTTPTGVGLAITPVEADPTRAITRALAVVGVRAGDGTSTVAANLAVVAARAGVRTVLVDANLHRPALHTLFGLPNDNGLTTALRSDDPRPLLQESPLPTLHVLTAGAASEEAIDLVGSPRMERLLQTLRAAADVVVLDAGLADTSESGALTALADSTVMIARLPNASAEALETAAERLHLAGAQTAGVAVSLFTTPRSNTIADVAVPKHGHGSRR